MNLSPPERETVITMNDEDETADIWTAQRPVITRLRKNPAAVLVEEGKHGSTAWARFTLPAELISFRSTRRSGHAPTSASLEALKAAQRAR